MRWPRNHSGAAPPLPRSAEDCHRHQRPFRPSSPARTKTRREVRTRNPSAQVSRPGEPEISERFRGPPAQLDRRNGSGRRVHSATPDLIESRHARLAEGILTCTTEDDACTRTEPPGVSHSRTAQVGKGQGLPRRRSYPRAARAAEGGRSLQEQALELGGCSDTPGDEPACQNNDGWLHGHDTTQLPSSRMFIGIPEAAPFSERSRSPVSRRARRLSGSSPSSVPDCRPAHGSRAPGSPRP